MLSIKEVYVVSKESETAAPVFLVLVLRNNNYKKNPINMVYRL